MMHPRTLPARLRQINSGMLGRSEPVLHLERVVAISRNGRGQTTPGLFPRYAEGTANDIAAYRCDAANSPALHPAAGNPVRWALVTVGALEAPHTNNTYGFDAVGYGVCPAASPSQLFPTEALISLREYFEDPVVAFVFADYSFERR